MIERSSLFIMVNQPINRSIDPSFAIMTLSHTSNQMLFRNLFWNTTTTSLYVGWLFVQQIEPKHVDCLAWFWMIPHKQLVKNTSKQDGSCPLDLGLPSAYSSPNPDLRALNTKPSHYRLSGTYHVVSNMRGPAAGRLDTNHSSRDGNPLADWGLTTRFSRACCLFFWFHNHLLESWALRMLVNTVGIVLAKTINILGQQKKAS